MIIRGASRMCRKAVDITEDSQIIELYFARNEAAIRETSKKYGKGCQGVAYRILGNTQDAEECTNDTWIHTWNAIPPDRPMNLFAYLVVIVRRIALDLYKKSMRTKRGGGQTAVVLEELEECLASQDSVEENLDRKLLLERIQSFLESLSPQQRKLFVQRYTYLMSNQDIAAANDMTESNVRVTLMRTRKALRETLEKEGLL